MDWQGLLKWSIAQSDGTAQKDVKLMDEQTRKWLTDAFEHYSYDEVKRMGEIVTQIMKPETNDQNDEEQRLLFLDELEEITSGLDRGKDFCKIGGMSALMQYMNETKYLETKLLALRIFTAANQNNTYVQDYSCQNGAFELLNILKAQNVEIKVLEQVVSAISSLVRGENLNNKRIFIDKNGFQIVFEIMCQNNKSIRIREKVLNIFKDFVYYDQVLHKTHNDIEKQSNTNSAYQQNQNKGVNFNLKDDINDQLKDINELPENKKYKDISKQILFSLQIFKLEFASLVMQNLENRYIDSRISYLEILQALAEKDKTIISPQLKEYLNMHKKKIDQNNEDFNKLELEYLEKILS